LLRSDPLGEVTALTQTSLTGLGREEKEKAGRAETDREGEGRGVGREGEGESKTSPSPMQKSWIRPRQLLVCKAGAPVQRKQELSYRKQMGRQLRTQYVEGIYRSV